MKTFQKILQDHIENNLRHVDASLAISLDKAHRQQLQKCLNLHYRLEGIRVKPVAGHHSLKEALLKVDSSVDHENRSIWGFRQKVGATVFACLLLIGIFSGLSVVNSNTSEFSSGNLSPNGTVENLQNLNLVGAELDERVTQTDTDVISSAEINLANSSKMDEAINEDF